MGNWLKNRRARVAKKEKSPPVEKPVVEEKLVPSLTAIRVYALSYHSLDFFKKSINSMLATASEPVNFIVIDNKSPESPEIAAYAKKLIDEGKIEKYIQLKNNSMIRAFNYLYETYPPDRLEQFFFMTELDLIVPEGADWIAETKKMQRRNTLTGFGLDLINYVPPNGGHYDQAPLFGFWLAAMNPLIFAKEYNRRLRGKNIPLSDNIMRGMFWNSKRVQRCSTFRLYHLGWDIWKTKGMEKYWERKLAGIDWELAPEPIVDFVYERKTDERSNDNNP